MKYTALIVILMASATITTTAQARIYQPQSRANATYNNTQTYGNVNTAPNSQPRMQRQKLYVNVSGQSATIHDDEMDSDESMKGISFAVGTRLNEQLRAEVQVQHMQKSNLEGLGEKYTVKDQGATQMHI